MDILFLKLIFIIYYCDCALINQNISYENVIEQPVNSHDDSLLRYKRNNHETHDDQRPNNYYKTLPSPLDSKDASFVREKRKQPEKVLLTPLSFSYNRKQERDSEAVTNDGENEYEEHKDNADENYDQSIKKRNKAKIRRSNSSNKNRRPSNYNANQQKLLKNEPKATKEVNKLSLQKQNDEYKLEKTLAQNQRKLDSYRILHGEIYDDYDQYIDANNQEQDYPSDEEQLETEGKYKTYEENTDRKQSDSSQKPKPTQKRKIKVQHDGQDFYFEETPKAVSNYSYNTYHSRPDQKTSQKHKSPSTSTTHLQNGSQKYHFQVRHVPKRIFKSNPNQQASENVPVKYKQIKTHKTVNRQKHKIENESLPIVSQEVNKPPSIIHKNEKTGQKLQNDDQERNSEDAHLATSNVNESSHENNQTAPEKYELQIKTIKKLPNEEQNRNLEITYNPIIDLKDFDDNVRTTLEKNLAERYKIEDSIRQKLDRLGENDSYESYPSETTIKEVESQETSIKNDPPKKYEIETQSSEESNIPSTKIIPTLTEELKESDESKSDSGETYKKISDSTTEQTERPSDSTTEKAEKTYPPKTVPYYKDPEKEYREHILPIKYQINPNARSQTYKDDVKQKDNQDDTYVPKTSQLDYDYTQESREYIPPQKFKTKDREVNKNNQKHYSAEYISTDTQKDYDNVPKESIESSKPKNYKLRSKLRRKSQNEHLRSTNESKINLPIKDTLKDSSEYIAPKKYKIRPNPIPERPENIQTRNLDQDDDTAHAPSDSTISEHKQAHAQSDSTASEQVPAHAQSDSTASEQKHPHAHNGKHAQGGGKEHHSEHHGTKGEHSESQHKGKHEHHKKESGHHDKEGHKGGYKDHGGHEKKSHSEKGYFGGHKDGAKGEKASEFKEHGEHKKGHSTKGEHNVHKKEEYSKTKHFFDESHEEGEHEKHGGFHEEKGHKKGGKHKYGHLKDAYKDDHYGKKGKHAKGSTFHEDKGHKEHGGHDKHYKHVDKYGKKDDHDHHKKWAFKKGHK